MENKILEEFRNATIKELREVVIPKYESVNIRNQKIKTTFSKNIQYRFSDKNAKLPYVKLEMRTGYHSADCLQYGFSAHKNWKDVFYLMITGNEHYVEPKKQVFMYYETDDLHELRVGDHILLKDGDTFKITLQEDYGWGSHNFFIRTNQYDNWEYIIGEYLGIEIKQWKKLDYSDDVKNFFKWLKRKNYVVIPIDGVLKIQNTKGKILTLKELEIKYGKLIRIQYLYYDFFHEYDKSDESKHRVGLYEK